MTALTKHPLFLPRYKGGDKTATLNISLVTACHPVSFWQSLRFGYWLLLGLSFVLCCLVAWHLKFPWLLFGLFWAIHGLGNTKHTKQQPPVLPLPFLGDKSCCQATPLATLRTDCLDWHIPPLDTQDDKALLWHFEPKHPAGIHRVDCVAWLVVYFVDMLSLDGTPCWLDDRCVLVVHTATGEKKLALDQFCNLVNERAYTFKKQCESDDDNLN